jgi:hypothetical protein
VPGYQVAVDLGSAGLTVSGKYSFCTGIAQRQQRNANRQS